MQILKSHGYLLGHLVNLGILQHVFLLMKHLKERPLVGEFSYHIVHVAFVYSDSHVEDHIGMSELIDDLNLFDKVLYCLLSQIPSSELLNGYPSA